MPSDPPPPTPPGARRAAVLFALGALALLAVAVALLSFDQPLARRQDPQTEDAYVGGDTVGIDARVQGYLVALPITDNQGVRAGDVLAQVDDADYRAQAEQAQAMVAAAEAQVQGIDAQIAQLAAQVGQQQTQVTAQQAGTVRTSPELVRQERLINTDVGVRRTLEQAQAQQRQAEAGVEAAQANLEVRRRQGDTMQAQREQAVAAVAARRADLALALINLRWTRLVAPADGTLGSRRVRVGDLLQPGATVTDLTPLDTVWVDANFTERQIPDMAPGQSATLRVDAFPGQSLDGHVAGLAPLTGSQLAAAPADNATGNFTKVVQRVVVRIAVDWHASPLRGLLRPGMSVVATVHTLPTGSGPAGAR